eukprot:CAMPEP_0169435086 /NCGR_PEP_ID=MMETSP1042-20121227/4877_1 /TAXON_ID=464988 /ORGANISM="Hemiselmis andersenii, Strain CCMP1180" /LENGTH=139 /DNA_ID=CAMNT_0009545709 /DNA_START=108 /DNA_END=523 /DNA_ORIENTATION=+
MPLSGDGDSLQGLRLLQSMLKSCERASRAPTAPSSGGSDGTPNTLVSPDKIKHGHELRRMMVDAGLGVRMTPRFCTILGVEEGDQADYRQFLLGLLILLAHPGGAAGRQGIYFRDAVKENAKRQEFLLFLFRLYGGELG